MDELIKRLEEIRARAAELRASETNGDVLTEIRALVAERKEIEGKIEAEKALTALEAEVAPEEAPAEETPAEEEAPAAPAEVTPAEVAAPEAPAEEEAAAPEAIAAALGGATPKATPQGDTERKPLAIIASAAGFSMSVGSRMEADDWTKVHRRATRAGEGEQRFAQINRQVSGEAVSSRNSALQNTTLMSTPSEEKQLESIMAAACYCGPFETDKEIRSLGENGRPIAGMFRAVPVTGPFQYVQDLTLGDVAPGVSQWTCAQQAAVVSGTPATWKPCVDLDCATPVQVDPYAVVACGRYSIFQEVSHPELIDDFINKLGIVYERTAEQLLLDELRATSTVLTHSVVGLGLLWELEQVLGHLIGLASYTRRISWGNYTLVLPPGMMEALILDEHLRGFSRGANEADIVAQLKALGVGNIVQALDADSTADADFLAAYGVYVNPGTTVAFDPATTMGTYTVHLVPVDAYARGESVLVDAGYTRDAELIRQNMTQYFFEGHEFLEKMTPDVPSFTIELTGCANGGSSALVNPGQC